MEPKPEDIFNSGNKPIAEKFSFQSKELEARLERFRIETEEEKILMAREVERRNKLRSASANEVEAIQLKDDGSAILKLKKNEREGLRAKAKSGTFYKRERAAYLVDKFFGFGLVPPTVIRAVDNEIGSCQKFVEDNYTIYEVLHAKFGYIERADDYESKVTEFVNENLGAFVKLFIFDYLIWNSDRHQFNFLMGDGKLWAIDNGLSFAADFFCPFIHSYRVVLKSGYTIDEKIKSQFLEVVDWKEGREVLRQYLGELLDVADVDAFFSRLDRLPKLLSEANFSDALFNSNYA